ncbi:MAG: GNAT family N-acetyltransferase [Clostridiales bacterium]|nr:GNAT family N-acetyltransferase [Clostridiales bacterium]
MTVRRAGPRDAAALCRLNAAFNGPGLADEAHIAQSLARQTAERAWILWIDGRPAGFLCAQLAHSLCYPSPSAEIAELYVEEWARRRGGALALIRAALAELTAEGAQSARVLTGVRNGPARALYERAGFLPDDEVLYQLPLREPDRG